MVTWLTLSSLVTQSAMNDARSDSLRGYTGSDVGRKVRQDKLACTSRWGLHACMDTTQARDDPPDRLAASKVSVSEHDIWLSLLDELHGREYKDMSSRFEI